MSTAATDRLGLALPIDVARVFDHTVTQAQIDANTWPGGSDDSQDVLESAIEGAEDEFRTTANLDIGVSRTGIPGEIETYEEVTYKLPGHQAFKRSWSRSARDYRPTEVEKGLGGKRIMPWDTTEGDEARVWRGFGRNEADRWEDISDDHGDTWEIIDYREGKIAIHPIKLHKALSNVHGITHGGQRLHKVRLRLTYRFGDLGRGRSLVRKSQLDEAITDTDTGATSVVDADVFPATVAGGALILLVGQEYVRANIDRSVGNIDILERGVRGSSASSHSSGDRVQFIPPMVRNAVSARAGMQMIVSGRYDAFLPDSEDVIDKSNMLEEMRSTWDTAVKTFGEMDPQEMV